MNIKYHRAKPYFSKDDRKDITAKIDGILKSGQLAQGKYVEEFERKFAKMTGSDHGIATNSCTSALEISIRALGIKNKTIMVTTNTFVASVNAIILSGNTPLIVDIDENTLCMSKESILKNLSDDVGAIMWVHMAGLISPDIFEIQAICRERGIYIIEDAAHAHGASARGLQAGNIGDVGCFSFYPTKVLATGEGGMITTNNKEVAEKTGIMRYHGVTRHLGELTGVDYGVHSIYSSQNFRMTETSAIIGISQLSHLDEFVRRRNEIAFEYSRCLMNTKGITLLPLHEGVHSYWNYYFIVDNHIDRNQLSNFLYNQGIENANAYYPTCHQQKLYNKFTIDEYPVADDILQRHLSLPMYVELSNDDVKYIAEKVIDWVMK